MTQEALSLNIQNILKWGIIFLKVSASICHSSIGLIWNIQSKMLT